MTHNLFLKYPHIYLTPVQNINNAKTKTTKSFFEFPNFHRRKIVYEQKFMLSLKISKKKIIENCKYIICIEADSCTCYKNR